MSQYTPLPTYAVDDVKEPLLSPTDDPVNDMENTGSQCCANSQGNNRCSGGWLGRIRSRCAARRLAKYGPPCENPGCVRKDQKRRKFKVVIFSLLAVFFTFHLITGAYKLATLPSRVHCQPLTSTNGELELPLTKKLFIDYGLTTSTTEIKHDNIPIDTVKINVEFEDIPTFDEEEKPGKVLLCSAQLHSGKAIAVGAYASKKHMSLPQVLKTTITLPLGVDGPGIRFGGKKAGHCVGGLIRKLVKWKGEDKEEDKE